MRRMRQVSILVAGVCALALAQSAFAANGDGVRAGTAGGVHGEVQIAKAEYTPSQRQIGHQIGSGEPIYMGDQIATGAGGGLQVMLMDQTVMTLGQNAKITIDEMVYDPKSGDGKLNFSVAQGAFRYVSGQIAKNNPENVNIKTPMATIGIRGTIVGGAVESGETVVALLGPGSDTNTSERHGAIVVTTPAGSVDITRTGYATVIMPGQPPAPPAPATPEQLQRFGDAGANGSVRQTASAASSPASGSSGTAEQSSTSASSTAGQTLVAGTINQRTVAPAVPTLQHAEGTSTSIAATLSPETTTAENGSTADGTANDTKNAQDTTTTFGDGGTKLSELASFSYSKGSSLTFESGYASGDCYPSLCAYSADNSSDGSVSLSSGQLTITGSNLGGSGTEDSITLTPVAGTDGDVTTYTGLTDTNGYSYSLYDYGKKYGLSYSTFGRIEVDAGFNTMLDVYSYGITTPTSQMPTAGTATYTGGATGYLGYSYSSQATDKIEGTVALTANFSSNTLSGTISNIVTSSSNTTTSTTSGISVGSITLATASISGSSAAGSASFTASSTTMLTNLSNMTGNYTAQFYGGAANEIGGGVTVTDASTTDYGQTIKMSYGAKR